MNRTSEPILPTAVNDALLEMMGECRHDYYPIPNADTPYERGRRWERLGCRKCEENDKPLIFGEDESAWGPVRYRDGKVEAPNVGDGHQVSLGEMVRLWLGDPEHSIRIYPDGKGYQAVASFRIGQHDAQHECWNIGDTPELALARALLAAAGREVE